MKKFTADFETATWLEDETFVWAWAVSEIKDDITFEYGNNIESFMDFCKSQKNAQFYFHNLKFDGSFIITWLLDNGFEWVEKKKDTKSNTFTTLISDLGQFYSIEVYYKKSGHHVEKTTFFDSLKIIPYSVKDVAKSFKLDIQKLELDYNKERSRDHHLSVMEIEYIKNDVCIMSKALNQLFNKGLTRMTSASNALSDYKKILGSPKTFEHFFPQLSFECDQDIRQAYKGGFTYLNPIYKEVDTGEGVVLDVNSLYPSVMYNKSLPFGYPVFFKGKYKEDKVYPLYIQMISCTGFKIKKNKIPTIQIKASRFYRENEYLEDSIIHGEVITLVFTNIDLKLALEQYEFDELEYLSGWKFKATNNLFKKYIDKWIKEKNEGTIEKNGGKRTSAKLMLNSLYGKFAKSTKIKCKEPLLENGVLRFKFCDPEIVNGIYIPVATFITSYAREITIRTSQAIKDYSINKYHKDLYCYS